MRSRLLIRHNDSYFVVEVEERFVSLLPAMLESSMETVLEPDVEQVRGVTYQLRGVPLLAQELRDDTPSTQINWLPRIVGPPDRRSHNICTVWYRRETAHVEFVDSSCTLRLELVEHRCTNRTFCPFA